MTRLNGARLNQQNCFDTWLVLLGLIRHETWHMTGPHGHRAGLGTWAQGWAHSQATRASGLLHEHRAECMGIGSGHTDSPLAQGQATRIMCRAYGRDTWMRDRFMDRKLALAHGWHNARPVVKSNCHGTSFGPEPTGARLGTRIRHNDRHTNGHGANPWPD